MSKVDIEVSTPDRDPPVEDTNQNEFSASYSYLSWSTVVPGGRVRVRSSDPSKLRVISGMSRSLWGRQAASRRIDWWKTGDRGFGLCLVYL